MLAKTAKSNFALKSIKKQKSVGKMSAVEFDDKKAGHAFSRNEESQNF